MEETHASRIAAMGTALGPGVLQRCLAVFDAEQQALAARVMPLASDCAYGPDPRHRLDVYAPAGAQGRPVLVFVHGGGFVLGDKAADGWSNAAVGRMAAERGWIGVVINYRLAPEHGWPAGSEDVARALDWVRANIAAHGGNPDSIILMGTSAGTVHCAGWLKHGAARDGVRGLVLLSGLYGYTPPDPKDERYYGDPALYDARAPLASVVEADLPMLIACAQFDPPRFQAEWAGLIKDRLAFHGTLPHAHFASGHNHYTMALHLGSADRRLADEIAAFVAAHSGG